MSQEAEPQAVQMPEIKSNKVFFTVDRNQNVVIRVVDSEGKLVKQIPPEEFAKMVKTLNDVMTRLLDIEA